MKRISFWFFSIIFSIALSIGVFFGAYNTSFSSADSITPEKQQTTLSDLFVFSQDNKVFDLEKDLSTAEFYGETYPAIYTNKNLSLTITHIFSTYDYYYIILSTYDGNNLNSEQIGNKTGGVNDTFYKPYTQGGRTIHSYNFNKGNLTYNYAKIQINFIVNNKEYIFDLVVVVTDNNFQTDENLYWEYAYNGISEKVKAPTIGATYSPITLNIPNGTKLNPTYAKFRYLGEEFIVYNIDGELYNAFDDSLLNINKITFDLSGSYEVEVYDRTAYCYDSPNHLTYSFIIKNTTTQNDCFYIHAHNANGKLVANSQIVNEDVIVNFVNLSDIIRGVDQIVVVKSWRPSGAENVTSKTVYQTNIPSSITITEDGTYNIRVIGKNGGNIIKEYDFVLLKSIRTYFEINNVIYEPEEDEPVNTNKVFTVENSFNSAYNNIQGTTNYTFNVTIAKSDPSIEGISNNGRKQGSVTLTVRGVGKIQVAITQDGKTTTTEATNGQKLEKLTTPGKYHIKITDEMGTTITKNFTITLKLNAAAKAIIAIGSILLTILIAFIVITRAKIKVK